MNRLDIVGWTLAELALVLLFALIAIMVPAYSRMQKRAEASALDESSKSSLQLEVAHLHQENVQLQASLEASRRGLRSSAKPSCLELGKGPDYLFTVTIKLDGGYEVLGQRYSIDGLLSAYRSPLEEADRNRCAQRIRVSYEPGVGTSEYYSSLQLLSEHFFIKPVGPRR